MSPAAARSAEVSYVLPLKWHDDGDRLPELTRYLTRLSRPELRCEVIVVDGSPGAIFDDHAVAWRDLAIDHCRPDPQLRYLNGKVNGVLTGIRRARHERVVIADDDVRYDVRALAAIADLLDEADAVVPQNVFTELPWHARWDTARSLLNRCFGADYAGTVAVRRSTLLRAGGYDGDVLFENLELLRTVAAVGGAVDSRPGLYVRRLPPSTAGFRGQRVRQAYDSFAQPVRLVAELAVLPALALAVRPGSRRYLAAMGAAVVGLAEIGRRRHGGAAAYPATAALWAPAWVLERGVCSWLALGVRYGRGGVSYAGSRIVVAANRQRDLVRLRVPADGSP